MHKSERLAKLPDLNSCWAWMRFFFFIIWPQPLWWEKQWLLIGNGFCKRCTWLLLASASRRGWGWQRPAGPHRRAPFHLYRYISEVTRALPLPASQGDNNILVDLSVKLYVWLIDGITGSLHSFEHFGGNYPVLEPGRLRGGYISVQHHNRDLGRSHRLVCPLVEWSVLVD